MKNPAKTRYLVDGEIVVGFGTAMERANAIFEADGIVVAIVEVADEV